jgi:hypothetical protein
VFPSSRQNNFFETSALTKSPDYTVFYSFGMLFHLLRLSIYTEIEGVEEARAEYQACLSGKMRRSM